MYGHWLIQNVGEFDPDEWFGFTYLIENKLNKRKYIGRKQLRSVRRQRINGRKNRKVHRKSSKWKEYTGTCGELNQDIEKLGKENFRFTIIKLCKTKRELGYSEVQEQFARNVLNTLLEDGTREYYNANIMSRWFVCNGHSEETKEKFRGDKNPAKREDVRQKMRKPKSNTEHMGRYKRTPKTLRLSLIKGEARTEKQKEASRLHSEYLKQRWTQLYAGRKPTGPKGPWKVR